MAEDFSSYPYSGEFITLNDAVDFICSVVYPDAGRDKDEKVKASKRVRRRINQAREDGLLQILEREHGKAILAKELFTWAAERRGWARLYLVPGLPRAISASANLRVPRFSVEAFAIEIPDDLPDREPLFMEMSIKLMKKECELDQLRLENDILRAEVDNQRAKKAEISKTRAESAKKPRPR